MSRTIINDSTIIKFRPDERMIQYKCSKVFGQQDDSNITVPELRPAVVVDTGA